MQIYNGSIDVESPDVKYRTVEEDRIEKQKKVQGPVNVHHVKDEWRKLKSQRNKFGNGIWLPNWQVQLYL